MRRLLIAATAAALLALPAAAEAKRFAGVALGTTSKGKAIPKHHFVVGDGYSLRLRDKRGAHTRYRVCLAWHGVNQYCAKGRTRERLAPGWSEGFNTATAPKTGTGYAYRWYVSGSLVARWRFSVGRGD